MKIHSSMVQMASDYSASEEYRMASTSRVLRRSPERGGRLPNLAGNVIRDSVVLQAGVAEEVTSTYSGTVTGESVVSPLSSAAGEAMVEGLVSRVTGLDMTLTRMEAAGGPDLGRMQIAPGNTQSLAWVRETQMHIESERVGFSALGQVETSDGRIVDFHLDLSMDRTMTTKTQQDALIRSRPVAMTDPLVISLDGRVPELTDTRFEFDLDVDGEMEEISFVSRGSGFLAFDKNGDGRINDGSELFGPGSGDGFTDLSVYDQDGNGWIDENDKVFRELSVWTRDAEGNNSLVSLAEAGVGAIFLGSAATPFDLKTADGRMKGQVAASGVFLFENGRVGTVQEIDLAVRSGQEEGLNATAVEGKGDPLTLWAPVTASNWGGRAVTADDPYKALQSNIEALKERMRQLLENRWGSSGKSYGSLYRANTPDRASFLMPNGSSFSRSTSIMSSSPVASKI